MGLLPDVDLNLLAGLDDDGCAALAVRVDDRLQLLECAGEGRDPRLGLGQAGALVPTDGVEPMASVAHMQLPMREDKVTDGDCRDKILQNAPQAANGFFAVPKVVE